MSRSPIRTAGSRATTRIRTGPGRSRRRSPRGLTRRTPTRARSWTTCRAAPALEAGSRPLMEVGVVSAPGDARRAVLLTRSVKGSQNQPVVYWRDGHAGEDRVLIDPAVLDPSGLTTVEWLSPSHDGRRLAYGTYRAGDENTTLHLLEVDTGERLPLEIPNKTQAAQWLPDGSGFVYQNLKRPEGPVQRPGDVPSHGRRSSRRTLELFRQFTRAENEKLATTWGPFGSLSRDGRWLLLGYWVDTKSERSVARRFRRGSSHDRSGGAAARVGRAGRPGLRHRHRRHARICRPPRARRRADRRRRRQPARSRLAGATSCPRRQMRSSRAWRLRAAASP